MSRSLDECEHGTASGHCSYCQEIAAMKRKLAIAKEALEFYADDKNWVIEWCGDYGIRASKALKELGETK